MPASGPTTRGDDEEEPAEEEWTAAGVEIELRDDSLVNASHQLAEAVETWSGSSARPTWSARLPETDRANLAKYLTIAKLKLENAIAMVRSSD